MVIESRREFLKATALAGLSLLVSPMFGENADAQTKPKGAYSLDEIREILGKRYEGLDETERRRVKTYYDFSEKSFPGYSYKHYVGVAYSNPEALHELLSRQKKDFKVGDIPEKDIDFYLHIFPWIKKEDIKKLGRPENMKNPDRLLLIATYYKQDYPFAGHFQDFHLHINTPPIRFDSRRRRRR